jgi:hypothetical protein
METLHATLHSMQRLSSAILEPVAVEVAEDRVVDTEALRLF